MIDEFILVSLVIFVFSIIQSVFGMGILVFGTPTLLLAGYDFFTTICTLLPSSMAISFLQVVPNMRRGAYISRSLYIFCVPSIAAGLWLVDTEITSDWTHVMIGSMLLLTALARLWDSPRQWLLATLERNENLYHLGMGLIHGLTNLGGAFLAILVARYSKDKIKMQYTTAHYYLIFSAIQISFLLFAIGRHNDLVGALPFAAMAALVHLILGNVAFARIPNKAYQAMFTVFMAAYGTAVLMKSNT